MVHEVPPVERVQQRTELLSGGQDRGPVRLVMGLVFAFLFYLAAILFGMAIANSVLEEKQNRVVEILATAVPVRQLLHGKVLGNSLLAFAQIGLYAAVGLAGREGDLFRKVLGWSLLLMILMCGIVYLQSTAVLDWMVVK